MWQDYVPLSQESTGSQFFLTGRMDRGHRSARAGEQKKSTAARLDRYEAVHVPKISKIFQGTKDLRKTRHKTGLYSVFHQKSPLFMPADSDRQRRIAQLREECKRLEDRWDRVENMGSMSDLEHAISDQIWDVSSEIFELEKLENEPNASPRRVIATETFVARLAEEIRSIIFDQPATAFDPVEGDIEGRVTDFQIYSGPTFGEPKLGDEPTEWTVPFSGSGTATVGYLTSDGEDHEAEIDGLLEGFAKVTVPDIDAAPEEAAEASELSVTIESATLKDEEPLGGIGI